MIDWILFLGIVNLAGCLIEFIVRIKKKRQPCLVIYFFMLPILGFLVYYTAFLLYRLRAAGSAYDRASLVMRINFRNIPKHPSMERELNIIPVEDAMAVSTNKEKRTLLLEQLKKGIQSNYRTVLRAGNDKDSESAHYVAAAKMEVSGQLLKQMHETGRQFEENPENPVVYLAYLNALSSYIGSGLPAKREAGIYKDKYCALISNAAEEFRSSLTESEYENYLTYLIERGSLEKAEEFWKSHGPADKTEEGYFLMLEMYYNNKVEEKFLGILDEIKNTPELVLSPEGLARFRYWIGRKEYAAS